MSGWCGFVRNQIKENPDANKPWMAENEQLFKK
jgi:hypothetical protein